MKKGEIFKSALNFQIKSIVLEKKNPDMPSPYPLKYTKRQNAVHIARSSGISVFAGINILLFIFLVLKFVSSAVLLGLLALLLLLMTYAEAQLASALYLFFIFLKEDKEQNKDKKSK